MPLDPEISLYAARGVPQSGLFGTGGNLAQTGMLLMNMRNQQQIFQARQLAGQIIAAAPDLETGLKNLYQDPRTAAWAGVIGNEYRQSMVSQADYASKVQNMNSSALKNFYGAVLPNFITSPDQVMGAAQAQYDALPDNLKSAMGPVFWNTIKSVTDGVPQDWSKLSPAEQQQWSSTIQKRVVGLGIGAGGWTPEQVGALTGKVETVPAGGYGAITLMPPAWAAGTQQPRLLGGVPYTLPPTTLPVPTEPGATTTTTVPAGGAAGFPSTTPQGTRGTTPFSLPSLVLPGAPTSQNQQQDQGVSESLLHGIWGEESRYSQGGTSTSGAGAVGPFQITKGFSDQFGQPGEDPNTLAGGAAIARRGLQKYLADYGNDPDRAAVAYFSGPGNVRPAGQEGTPWLKDKSDRGELTSQYVANVHNRMLAYNNQQPNALSPQNQQQAQLPLTPGGRATLGVAGPTPEAMEESKATGTKVADMRDDLAGDARTIPTAMYRIDALIDSLGRFQAGGGTDFRVGVAQGAQALYNAGITFGGAITPEKINDIASGSLPDAQAFQAMIRRQAISNLKEDAKGTGRVMKPEVDAYLNSLSEDQDPAAMIKILNQARQSYAVGYDRAVKYPQYKALLDAKDPSVKGMDPLDYYAWHTQNYDINNLSQPRNLYLGPVQPDVARGGTQQLPQAAPKATHRFNPATGQIEEIPAQ